MSFSFSLPTVAWTFSYSYSINHGGNARSSVSFSRGWPANSRSNYRLNPHFQTAHYSPPNGIQYRPQTQPVPLLPPQSPPLLAPINSQPPPPQTPQFQPLPPPQPLPAPGKPSQNTYSQNRFDRICSRSDGLKGFPVGVTSKTNEQCYYLCSTGRRFLSRPFYFCCPSGFTMDYDKRLCVEVLSTPQTATTAAPPAIKRVLTPDMDWSKRRRTGSAGPSNFKSGTEKPMGRCVPGMPSRAHPSKCDHYLQCVFDAYYIDMKCPANLAWNDRRKYCDAKRYSTCEDKNGEVYAGDYEIQRRNRKHNTAPPPPPPSDREYDESHYSGVKIIRPINPTRERVLQVPRPLGTTTTTTIRPEVMQIQCTNRFQEAFYRRRYGIDCRRGGAVKSKTNEEGGEPELAWPEKTAYGRRRKKPFWWSFGGNKGVKGVKGSGGGGDEEEDTKSGTKSGTKTGIKRPPVKSRPTTVITTTTTTTTEAPFEMTTEATPEPTTRFSRPTTIANSQVTESTDSQETQVTEDDDTMTTNRRTTIRNTPTTPSVITTVQLPETTASEVFTRRPPTTTIFTTITNPPTTAKQLPELTTEFTVPTIKDQSTVPPTTTVLTTTVVPPTTVLQKKPPTITTTTLPTTQTNEDYDQADDEADDNNDNNNQQTTSKAATTTTTTPFPSSSLETIPPPLPTHAPLVNITSTTTLAPETTTFAQIFEENARCLEPGQRLKDADDCQCYFECQLNRQLTRNCCPEGLLFNQNESKPGSSASNSGGDAEADAESEDSEGEQGACDIASNVQCLTTIQVSAREKREPVCVCVCTFHHFLSTLPSLNP